MVKARQISGMMSEKRKKQLIASLEKSRVTIENERDRIRDILDEFKEIAYDCDEAIEHLEQAADSLSRYL